MPSISLNTAIAITGLSRRTLWRRIADGSLRAVAAEEGNNQTRVELGDVLALTPHAQDTAYRNLVIDADAGAADAQCDLALLLLAQERITDAVSWLRLAAQSFYPEAFYWLGRCALIGKGMTTDEAKGIDWIRQAARRGHSLAAELLPYLEAPDRPRLEAAALDAALDEIERALVQRVLHGLQSGKTALA